MPTPDPVKLRSRAQIARAERKLTAAARQAIDQYLGMVRGHVLDGRGGLTAAAAPKRQPGQPDYTPVDLTGINQAHAWPGIIDDTLIPAIDDLLDPIVTSATAGRDAAVIRSVQAFRAQWLADRRQSLAGVADALTGQMRDDITADWQANGPDPMRAAAIARQVLADDNPSWQARAETIGRTETVSCLNQASHAAMTAVAGGIAAGGGQVFKTWVATEDSRTRPEHADVDGTEIGVDEQFDVGGQAMNAPGDPDADPDQTVNCRCTVTYRVEEPDGSSEETDGPPDAGGDDQADTTDGGGETSDVLTAATPGGTVTAPAPAKPTPKAPADGDAPYEPKPYHADPDETVECPACQKLNSPDAVYCDQCGHKLAGDPDVTTAAPADDTATTAAAPPTDLPAQAPEPGPAVQDTDPDAAQDLAAGPVGWQGLLLPTDAPTPDGRMMLSAGGIIRALPLTLSYQAEDEHGGMPAGTAVRVGRILTATIDPGKGGVWATGDWLDPDADWTNGDAIRAAVAVVDQGIGTISPNVAPIVVSFGSRQPDGSVTAADPSLMPDDDMTPVMIAEQWEFIGATLVQSPAFGDAKIFLTEKAVAPAPVVAAAADGAGPAVVGDHVEMPDGTQVNIGDPVTMADGSSGSIASVDEAAQTVTVSVDTGDGQPSDMVTVDVGQLTTGTDPKTDPDDTGLTAAGAYEPTPYVRSWFEPVALDGPTRLTVTDDGRVFGHLAAWGTCHTGFRECVSPPSSPSGYAHFHVRDARMDDGSDLPVGVLTVGGGHADINLGWRPSLEHYDNAGNAVAVVRAHEDEHGVQVTGQIVHGTDQAQVERLRVSPLSGDWRPIGGARELIAALAVNTPGFPIPKASFAAGKPAALVAAGVIHEPPAEVVPETVGGITLPSGHVVSEPDLAFVASVFAAAQARTDTAAETAQRAARDTELRALRAKVRLRLAGRH